MTEKQPRCVVCGKRPARLPISNMCAKCAAKPDPLERET